jgi:acetyl esterase/lipase
MKPKISAVCEIKRVKNCSILADVFLPAGKKPPVVLFFHGGALISGSRKYLPGYQARMLREAGFAVVAADYRLAPETKLEAIIADVRDAVCWTREEGANSFEWDAERVAVMGSSAGGYLSLLSGTFEEKPRALVSFYGYGDILGEWYTLPSEYYCRSQALIPQEAAERVVGGREKSRGSSKRYAYYFYCRQQGIWPQAVSGWDPAAEREKLLRYCPAANVGTDYPPTLLLHGDADTDVPYEQSVQMVHALDARGIENRLVTMPGGGHGFDGDGKNPAVRQIFEDVVDFLHLHV